MNLHRDFLWVCAALGFFAATASAAPPSAAGIDLAGMDRAVLPGDDFFRFANGGWLARTVIPSDRASDGTGEALSELTAHRTTDLIQEAARSARPGSEAQKIGDFYSSFMDETAIEKKGVAPLTPILSAIDAIADLPALSRMLGDTLRADVDVLNATEFHTANLLGLWVAQDLTTPNRYVPFLLQGGLGLPDRDYYLDATPRMADLRTKYQAYIAALLKRAGIADSDAKAARIFALEHAIAVVHWPREQSEDVTRGNNHWSRAQFDKGAPGLNWTAFFGAAGLDRQSDFVVWQPSALRGISALVHDTPLSTWKEYLAYHAIDRFTSVLPKRFTEETFDFYGRVLSGTTQERARWKRAIDATDGALGEAVGKLYVARYFPPAEKARAEAMVKNVLAAFGKRIDALSWMAPETKARAKAKLAVLKVGVGYPDHWRDYSALRIVRGDAFGNKDRAQRFRLAQELAKLGKPVDRSEWVMNPQLVNAVNLPAMNALNFPAAILQPPYFDPQRAALMDYGAAGATIGHEISHSFDDQGALFDADGRLKNWWTTADFAHFKASGAQLAAQFDAYHPFADAAVNGKLTLSENIADVAGLSAAYDAYRGSLGGQEAATVAGLSGDQQFFLSFAQSWRNKAREAAARRQLITDGHAPDEYRADTVRNLDAWYSAFDIKAGQKLFLAPATRVKVW